MCCEKIAEAARLRLEKAGLDPIFFAWPPEREPASAQFRGAVAGAQGVAGRMGQGAGSCRLRRRQRVARSPITAIKSDDGRAVGSRGRRQRSQPSRYLTTSRVCDLNSGKFGNALGGRAVSVSAMAGISRGITSHRTGLVDGCCNGRCNGRRLLGDPAA
jgi:hypothetical protein